MNLILHSDTATTFNSNGIGVLADAITAKVVRELNGQYELTLKYPDTGMYAEFITDRHIVMAKPDPVADPQPFRIYRVNPVSKGTITAYARHIAYDTMGIPCAPFSATSCMDAVRGLSANAATECPFSFTTNKIVEGKLSVDVPKSIWSIMGGTEGSILDQYGGEYDFDWYNITLYNRLGADRGVSIRYGKNLTTLEQDRNCASVYTGVFPYWKPYDGDVVMLPEQIIYAGGTYNFTRILPLDLSEKYDEAPTESQLREAAEKYMVSNNIGVPDVSWTVQFVQMEQSEEYKGMALLERVLLGDTVSVIFPQMNVNASARAVKIDFDPIMERYNSITLGKVKSDLATTIAKQQQAIERAPSYSKLEAAVERATSWITNGKGYMIAVKDAEGNWKEICSLDTPDINQATKVWRWNNGGFGFSATGYNGPYRLAMTQDGEIVADFITTGKLDAALVEVVNLVAESIVAGTLSSKDGLTKFNLDTGIISLNAEPDAEGYASNLRLVSGGLWGDLYKDGENQGTAFSLAAGKDGSILRSWGGRHLYLGADSPIHLRGTEIYIEGAPIYLGGKSLQWYTDADTGISYLCGVEVTE